MPAEVATRSQSFFVSYTAKDKAWAEWISWILEDEGYTVRIQAWDFRPGGQFPLAMQEAISECDRTIAVLSPDYVGAQFTQVEWGVAFAADPTGKGGKLVPVRVHPFQPSGAFATTIFIDLVGLDEERARQTLLGGVQRGRAKPVAKPEFPGIAPPPGAGHAAPVKPEFPGGVVNPAKDVQSPNHIPNSGEGLAGLPAPGVTTDVTQREKEQPRLDGREVAADWADGAGVDDQHSRRSRTYQLGIPVLVSIAVAAGLVSARASRSTTRALTRVAADASSAAELTTEENIEESRRMYVDEAALYAIPKSHSDATRSKVAVVYLARPNFSRPLFESMVASINPILDGIEIVFPDIAETVETGQAPADADSADLLKKLDGLRSSLATLPGNEDRRRSMLVGIWPGSMSSRDSKAHNLFVSRFGGRVVVVSTGNTDIVSPKTQPSVFKYLLTTLVTMGAILAGHQDLKIAYHDETRGCLFDYNNELRRIRLGIESGQLCSEHRQQLASVLSRDEMHDLEILPLRWLH